MAGFTESSGVVPDFPWTEAAESEVCQLPPVLIGGILLSGGGCYRKPPAEASEQVVPVDVPFTLLRVQSLRLLAYGPAKRLY